MHIRENSSMTGSRYCSRLQRKSHAKASPRLIRKCSTPGEKSSLNSGSERNAMTLRLAVMILALAGTLAAEDLPTVTLNDFPEYAVAGTPLKLTFTARNQGQTLLPGLRPTIHATGNGGLNAKSNAIPGKDIGEYISTLTLPRDGEWTITIASGFNGGTL